MAASLYPQKPISALSYNEMSSCNLCISLFCTITQFKVLLVVLRAILTEGPC